MRRHKPKFMAVSYLVSSIDHLVHRTKDLSRNVIWGTTNCNRETDRLEKCLDN